MSISFDDLIIIRPVYKARREVPTPKLGRESAETQTTKRFRGIGVGGVASWLRKKECLAHVHHIDITVEYLFQMRP